MLIGILSIATACTGALNPTLLIPEDFKIVEASIRACDLDPGADCTQFYDGYHIFGWAYFPSSKQGSSMALFTDRRALEALDMTRCISVLNIVEIGKGAEQIKFDKQYVRLFGFLEDYRDENTLYPFKSKMGSDFCKTPYTFVSSVIGSTNSE